MATMLERLVLKKNLKQFLVQKSPNHNWPKDTELINPADPINRTNYYNVFLDHAIFNETRMDKAMSRNAKYIATLRYPLEQLRSLFHEMAVAKQINMSEDIKDQLVEFFNHLDYYTSQPWKRQKYLTGPQMSDFGRNIYQSTQEFFCLI